MGTGETQNYDGGKVYTLTFSPLADAFIQRKQSKSMQHSTQYIFLNKIRIVGQITMEEMCFLPVPEDG